MIINLLINLVLLLFGALFSFMPVVTLADIPFIGEGFSNILTTAVLSWNAFCVTFPYAVTAWHALLWVILPFEIALLVLKFFLGHRTPAHMN